MLVSSQGAPRTASIVMLCMALAACGATVSSGTSPDESARLRLVDQCMAAAGQGMNAQQATAPGCQCYARGMMSAAARESEVTATCARNPNAFTRAAARPRAKKE